MINYIKRYKKYLAVILGIFLFSLLAITNNKDKDIKVESEKKLSKKEATTTVSKIESKGIYVDIKGAVITPGVYEMTSSSRVIDVINLAGGLKDTANTSNLNLSKKVFDEMYIIVYTNDEIQSYLNDSSNESCTSLECICPNSENDACITKDSSVSKENKVSGKVSINEGTKEELMSLSGIGEVKADAIIKYREEHGNFASIEDIKNVSGISDSTYEKIKDNITT